MRLALRLCHALLTGLLLGPVLLHAATPATGHAGYTVAIIPVMPPSETKRRWQPLLDQLGRDTGLAFQLRFHDSVENFEKSLGKGEVDLVVASPLITWRERDRYRPLVRGRDPLTGIVIVARESPVNALRDLQGKRLAQQEGERHSANLLVSKTLREQRIAITPLFTSSENNALRSVLLGKAEAAVVNNYLLKLLPPEIGARVRIIHRMADLPPPPIAALRSLPAADLAKVKAALLQLRQTHPALLEGILMPHMVDAAPEEYSGIGKLLSLEGGNGP